MVPLREFQIKKGVRAQEWKYQRVIVAFSLVLAYDLLQDRRTIDVIISKFFPLSVLSDGTFENLEM